MNTGIILTGDTIDDNKGAISDTKSSCDLAGEVNVTRRVDQVNQESSGVFLLLLDKSKILIVHLEVHGDGGRLDGNTSLLLVLPGVGGTSLTSLGGGNNTGLGHKGVCQSRLAVVDVGNDRHVSDVFLLVHTCSDFVDGKVHLNIRIIR